MRPTIALMLLLSALALIGCGGSVSSKGIANVRGVSLIGSPAQVDIYSDFNLIGFGLSIGQASGYSLQQATVLSIGVRQTGTTNALDSINVSLDNNTKYTVYAYPATGSALGLFLLTDTTSDPGVNKFKFRLVHLDRLEGPVDVYYTDPDTDLAGETPVITNVSFENATPYIALDSGLAKQVRVVRSGTNTVVGIPMALTAAQGATMTVAFYDSSGPATTLFQDN